MKKHISQMSPSEIDLLENKRRCLLYSNRPFRYSKHFLDNAYKRGISKRDAKETVIQGEIIEFHDRCVNGKIIDKRVLIRSKKIYKKCYHLCVVYSLWYKSLITAYYNDKNDHHPTLDYTNYNRNHCITLLRPKKRGGK